MQITETGLAGLFIIETAPSRDERGYFHRFHDAGTFKAAGIDFTPRQGGLSYSGKRATLRGMHYQNAPVEQLKLVRCLRGAIFDVAIDLRAGSATLGKWFGIELTGENSRSMFVPQGFAHGFITLTDDAEVLYELGAGERTDLAAGVRWNDPAFGIRWPLEPEVVNARDAGWPDWKGD
jgi:dTDP-4-dehydrorhamnose 3,5-epimerase